MLERKIVEAEKIIAFTPFRNLSKELIEEVQEHSRAISLNADEPLFRQDEPARRSYFCLAGALKLFRLTPTGSEKIFHIASEGDTLFDSISIRADRAYPVHCMAMTASELMSMDIDFLLQMLDRSQHARMDLVDSLIGRADDLLCHAELLSVDKASFRVSSFLLEEYRRNGNTPRFRLRYSKKNIASYLSLQPETLSRCLRALRDDSIASSNARDIEILDPTRLEQMVCGGRAAA
ncbi:MAG: Crp/Fnr family transcriptional regulator [Candidatus Wenzhouxiangella sp. M2_3B_020]